MVQKKAIACGSSALWAFLKPWEWSVFISAFRTIDTHSIQLYMILEQNALDMHRNLKKKKNHHATHALCWCKTNAFPRLSPKNRVPPPKHTIWNSQESTLFISAFPTGRNSY